MRGAVSQLRLHLPPFSVTRSGRVPVEKDKVDGIYLRSDIQYKKKSINRFKYTALEGEAYYGSKTFIKVRLGSSPAQLVAETQMLQCAQTVVRNGPVLILSLP